MTAFTEIKGGRLFELPVIRGSERLRNLKTRLETRKLYEESRILPRMKTLRDEVKGKLHWVSVHREHAGEMSDRVGVVYLGRVLFGKLPPDRWVDFHPPALQLKWGNGRFLRVEGVRHQKCLLIATGAYGVKRDEVCFVMPENLKSLEWGSALSILFCEARDFQEFTLSKAGPFAILDKKAYQLDYRSF